MKVEALQPEVRWGWARIRVQAEQIAALAEAATQHGNTVADLQAQLAAAQQGQNALRALCNVLLAWLRLLLV